MFFVLSKILFFIIQPIVWLIALLGWANFTKNLQKRRRILRGVFWGVVLITNPFLSNRVFHAWEYPVVPIESLRDTFDVGIVLGGFSTFDVYTPPDRLNFNTAANRLSDAIILYKKGVIKKILLTGGSGKLIGQNLNEADETLKFLIQLGISPNDILIENQSKNTRENAVFTKKLLDERGFSTAKCLLITSAFHQRRSIGCFNKVGVNFQPFSAHFVAQKLDWDFASTILPDNNGFQNWEMFIKEWIGYAVYWMQGYI